MTYTFREYPKWIAGRDGPLIVENAETERTLIGGPLPPIVERPGIDRCGPPDLNGDGARCGTEHIAALTPATTWRPGLPVVTAQDHEEWQAWKRDRALTLQRQRRERLRRIDYYPSDCAAAIIDRLTVQWGGSAGSTLDKIVAEWSGIPELNNGK